MDTDYSDMAQAAAFRGICEALGISSQDPTASILGLDLHVYLGLQAEPSIHVEMRTAGAEVLKHAAGESQRVAGLLLEELAGVERI